MPEISPLVALDQEPLRPGASRWACENDRVDVYPGRLADDLRAARAEVRRLRDQLAVKAQAAEDLRATERVIGQALLAAQGIADDMTIEAAAQRCRLLSEAEAERVSVLDASRREAAAVVASAWSEAATVLEAAKREAMALLAQARDQAEEQLAHACLLVRETADDMIRPGSPNANPSPDTMSVPQEPGQQPSGRGRHFAPRGGPPTHTGGKANRGRPPQP